MLRRFRGMSLALAAALVAAALLAGCGGGGGGESGGSAPDKVRIGYLVSANSGLLAKQRDVVTEEMGAPVEWRVFDSGAAVITALTAGDIDVALAGTTAAATGIANDLPVEVVGVHNIIGEVESLAVKSDAGISSVADLAGKTAAVPFGSTTHFAMLRALEEEGVPLSDVKILDLQPQEMVAAWGRGDIDAGYVWQPFLDELESDGGEILLTSQDLADQGIVTADLIVANSDFAEQYPDQVSAYVKAIDDAVKFYREDETGAAEAVSSEIDLETGEIESLLSGAVWLDAKEQTGPEYMGTSGNVGDLAATLKDTGDFMMEQEAIENSPELSAYEEKVNPKFLEAASGS